METCQVLARWLSEKAERFAKGVIAAQKWDACHRARFERHRAQIFAFEIMHVALAARFGENDRFIRQRGEIIRHAQRVEFDVKARAQFLLLRADAKFTRAARGGE